MMERCEDVIEGSEVIVVGLPDKRIIELLYSRCKAEQIILDLSGAVDRNKIVGKYYGLCW
jgi:hypothetical protein